MTAPAISPPTAALTGLSSEPTVWMASRPPAGKARNVGSQRLKVMSVSLTNVRCTLRWITYAVHQRLSRTVTKDSSQPYPRPRRKRGSLTPDVILDDAEAVA